MNPDTKSMKAPMTQEQALPQVLSSNGISPEEFQQSMQMAMTGGLDRVTPDECGSHPGKVYDPCQDKSRDPIRIG